MSMVNVHNSGKNCFNNPTTLLKFQVSGLNSGRGLKMTIYAVNANGKSESSTLEGFTLKVAELQLGEIL